MTTKTTKGNVGARKLTKKVPLLFDSCLVAGNLRLVVYRTDVNIRAWHVHYDDVTGRLTGMDILMADVQAPINVGSAAAAQFLEEVNDRPHIKRMADLDRVVEMEARHDSTSP